jgi:hypothetical protein
MEIEVINSELKWNELRTFVRSHHEAIALSAREDLLMILNVMELVATELMLDKFDQIQIYRGGLDVLRISTGVFLLIVVGRFSILGNKVGRSVFVEINEYRRRVNTLLTRRRESYGPFIFGAISGLLVAAVAAYTMRYKS